MNENDLEEKIFYNKWSKIVSSKSEESVLATSQFFYPLDVSAYCSQIRVGERSLVSVEIWPSSYCNHHCTFCSSDMFGQKNKGMISLEALKKIISDICLLKTRIIRFSGGGEPFLVDNFASIFPYASKKGLLCSVISNGSLLKKQDIEILARHLSIFRISFNAGNAKAYEMTHRKDDFNKVVKNMTIISKRRSVEGRENELLLGVTFLVTSTNYTSISRSARIIKDIGFDFFLLRGINPSRIRFAGYQRDVLLREIEKSHELKDENFFVSGSINKLDGSRGNKKLFPRCSVGDFRAYISPNGNVFPCFSALMSKELCAGNIFLRSIIDIWEGDVYAEMSKRLSEGKLSNCCQRFCDNNEFNAFISWIKSEYKENHDVKYKKIPRKWAKKYLRGKIDWF